MLHLFYYRMRQVLQNAVILLQNATEQNVMFIKNCVGTPNISNL